MLGRLNRSALALGVLMAAAWGQLAACTSESPSSGPVDAAREDAEDSEPATDASEDAPDADVDPPDAEQDGDAAPEDASGQDAAPMDSSAEAGEPDADGSSDAPDGDSGLAETDAADAAGDASQPDTGSDAEADADAAVACPSCPDQRCLPDGTCVECGPAWPCQNGALKCDLGTHTCVACLPSADDCPSGSYCADNFQCVRGCKNAGSCASGRCGVQHECERCLEDGECGAGRVCGSFACGPSCGNPGDPACGGSTQCCEHRCVDFESDIQNCGGCGIRCGADQFCGTGGCTPVRVGNLCEVDRATLVLSGLSGDAAESALLQVALEDGCAPDLTTTSTYQSESDLVNPETGQPVAGGDHLLVTLGSSYANKLVDYLEKNRIAPVYFVPILGDPASFEFRHSGSNQLLFRGDVDAQTPTHAHFIVQLVRDPKSGSLVLCAYGYWAEGTVAARWFIENRVLPNLGSFSETWYLYEWTSDNDNAGPDAADTFALFDLGT